MTHSLLEYSKLYAWVSDALLVTFQASCRARTEVGHSGHMLVDTLYLRLPLLGHHTKVWAVTAQEVSKPLS